MARSSTKFNDLSFLESKGYTFGTKISRNRVSKVKFGNSELACKVIKKKSCEDDRAKLETLKTISHPNIIPLHSIVQKGSVTCTFTQWTSGGNLFDLLKRYGRINERGANFWFHQIVCAVEYLHLIGIAHGSLSCKKILICQQNLKLCGLEDLSWCDDDSKLHFKPAQSTPKYYLPPEFHAGDPVDAKKSDIYSLGTILFMMVHAKIPFLTNCTNQLFDDQTRRRYMVNASSAVALSVDCQVMLHVLLEPDPKTRFSIERIRGLKWLQKYVDNRGDS